MSRAFLSKTSKAVGLWSTNYTEVTGQAIVTLRVVSHVLPKLGKFREYVFPSGGRPRALMAWALAFLGLWWDAIFGRVAVLYLVCSRSNIGFLRDSPALWLARLGLPILVHTHGSDLFDLLTNRWLSPIARWLYKPCHLVVPSKHLSETLSPYFASLTVCENFFEGTEICVMPQTQNQRPKVDYDGLTVLWNSNIMASKGFFDVHAAIQDLHAAGLPIHLVASGRPIGDAEMTMLEVENQLRVACQSPATDFRGHVPHQESISLLSEADVVVLPSRYSSELQPVSIIEAMCAGKALLVTDTPVFHSIMESYPAAFVPPKDVEALKRELVTLLDTRKTDPERFAAARSEGAQVAKERFSTARFDEKIKFVLSKHLPN
jgi:glycosyltransferase involved in cell wall biosynthesis